MKYSAYFLIIFGLFHPPWTVSFSVTKYDVNTFLKYYRSLDEFYNGSQGYESFTGRNFSKFCHQLRHAYHVKIVQTKREFWQPPILLKKVYMNRDEIRVEENDGQMRLVKFRIENTHKVLTLRTFSCLNYVKELKWLVAPAFVPDSAFLFSIQSFYGQSPQRVPSGQNEMVVRFEGVIDELATLIPSGRYSQEVFIRSTKQMNAGETDSICDLNAMLKYRLCAMYSKGVHPRGELMLHHTETTVDYVNTSVGCYLLSDHECKAVTIALDGGATTITRTMLRCFINNPGRGPGDPFYLSGHSSNPYLVSYIKLENKINTLKTVTMTHVPLLTHVGVYKIILHNFTLV